MSLADLWTSLENWPVAGEIGATWWFPLLESIHVLTATLLVGSILMVDLRLLGLAGLRYRVNQITSEVVPWTLGAATISVVTGIGLFITRASHYAQNTAFLIKMTLLVVAAVNMAVYHLLTAKQHRDNLGFPSSGERLAGASSLLLWVGILLAGRWTGHLL